MRPLLPRPTSGLKEYLNPPILPPTSSRGGGRGGPVSLVSQVELGAAQTRPAVGGKREGLGLELLGGKWRSEWLAWKAGSGSAGP